MRKIKKTTGDGSPIIEGNENTVINNFIRKHGFLFKIFVGVTFFACLLFVYNFYNVGVYPYFEEKVCISDRTPKGNIAKFIYKVVSNDKKIVYFDNVLITYGECDKNLLTEYRGEEIRFYYKESDEGYENEVNVVVEDDIYSSGISYQFNFWGLIDDTDDMSNEDLAKYLIEFNGIEVESESFEGDKYKKTINKLSILWEKGYSGYNIALSASANSSYATVMSGVHGETPRLDGLFQVNSDWQGEQTSFELSSPDPANVDNKRYECTKLDKSNFIKFFMCPFL